MHYYAIVVIPADGDVDELVTETLAPYSEDLEVEQLTDGGETYWHNPHGLWDWWQIGGRYTGRLSGYKPAEDPALLEECFLCRGTGMRMDEAGIELRAEQPDYTCNGCSGKGKRVLWSSDWPSHDGDIVDLSVEDVTAWVTSLGDEQVPYTIFAHGSESVTTRERWTGKDFVPVHDKHGMRVVLATILQARLRAGLPSRAVVVDYHD